MRRVPLTRRNLLGSPRRFAASAAVVGLAIALVLLLEGMWAGARAQASAYDDHLAAQLVVVAPNAKNLFADGSSIPTTTITTVRATRGVVAAAPIRTLYGILELHTRKVAVALVGYEPGSLGGPWRIATGRTPIRDDEVALDRVLAQRHGLRVGSRLDINGRELRVAGLTDGTSGFMTPYVFATHNAVNMVLRTPGTTSAVLVKTTVPNAVRERLVARGLTVRTTQDLRRADVALVMKIFGKPLNLMVAVALVAGVLVIALTAYAGIASRGAEYGVIRAIGGTRARLVGLAAAETLGVTVAGIVAGLVMFVAGRAWVLRTRVNFSIALTYGSLVRALVAALVMAAIAATVPASRLARLEPAVAFRSRS
jgi:putative ABC transport system permease protein